METKISGERSLKKSSELGASSISELIAPTYWADIEPDVAVEVYAPICKVRVDNKLLYSSLIPGGKIPIEMLKQRISSYYFRNINEIDSIPYPDGWPVYEDGTKWPDFGANILKKLWEIKNAFPQIQNKGITLNISSNIAANFGLNKEFFRGSTILYFHGDSLQFYNNLHSNMSPINFAFNFEIQDSGNIWNSNIYMYEYTPYFFNFLEVGEFGPSFKVFIDPFYESYSYNMLPDDFPYLDIVSLNAKGYFGPEENYKYWFMLGLGQVYTTYRTGDEPVEPEERIDISAYFEPCDPMLPFLLFRDNYLKSNKRIFDNYIGKEFLLKDKNKTFSQGAETIRAVYAKIIPNDTREFYAGEICYSRGRNIVDLNYTPYLSKKEIIRTCRLLFDVPKENDNDYVGLVKIEEAQIPIS